MSIKNEITGEILLTLEGGKNRQEYTLKFESGEDAFHFTSSLEGIASFIRKAMGELPVINLDNTL